MDFRRRDRERIQEAALLKMMREGDGEWKTIRLNGRKKTIWKVKPYVEED